MTRNNIVNVFLRISLGWIFFWSFLDKVFGLGFSTPAGKAWLDGVSPTFGFLKFATKGPLAGIFQNMAGNVFVDWLFMLGLFFVGVCLLSGIAVKMASYAGIAMLALMYAAGSIPPLHNPFVDEHIIYIIVLTGLSFSDAGNFFGLGVWWSKTKAVEKFPFLK